MAVERERIDVVREHAALAARALGHIENNTTDQASGQMTVPVGAYLDAARWREEIDRIFLRLPLMLALSIELPKPHDYKAMEVGGKPVLITRTKDGQAKALLNVCKHRAMTLVDPGHGNCAKFSCQYHGWTYASDGRLVGIAESTSFGEIDKASLALTELPCQEVAGMIFVMLTPGRSIDVPGFLGSMLDEMAALKLGDWYYHTSKELIGANWKVAFDGYLEGYHFAAAHPHTVTPRSPSNRAAYAFHGPHILITFPQVGIRRLHELPESEWGRQENRGYDFIRVLFPNVTLFLAPEMCQIAQIIPGPTPDRNRTIMNYIFPKKPDSEEGLKKLDDMCSFFAKVVNDEDYLLGLKVQKGLESGAMTHVTFGRNEPGNQHFHRMVDEYMKGT